MAGLVPEGAKCGANMVCIPFFTRIYIISGVHNNNGLLIILYSIPVSLYFWYHYSSGVFLDV